MRRVPQLSLASIVCPSAPFLAPRLLRIVVPTITVPIQSSFAAQCTRRSRYATASTAQKPLGARIPDKVISSQSEKRALLQLARACQADDVKQIQELYPSLVEAGIISPRYIRSITRSVLYRVRGGSASMALFPFVQQITADLQRGAFKPDPYTCVFLLGIYSSLKQYHEGFQLWLWLLDHDDYMSQEVYGAAIELMANGKLVPLPKLEELYMNALKRFPGTFAEYHLSPDAIVPDRTRPNFVPDIPVVLFQGIYTARVLARKWRPAYLALDTILRLYPTQTPMRFLDLNIRFRPIAEAYSTFMVACRSGVTMTKATLTSLMTYLMLQMRNNPSMAERLMLLRGMANASFGYLQAKGSVNAIHIGTLLQAFAELLPRPPPGQDYEGAVAQLRDCIVHTAYDLLSGLLKAGMPVSEELFVGMAIVAANLHEPGLFKTIVNDIDSARIVLDRVRTRTMLICAGSLGDRGSIEQFWTRIVSACESDGILVAKADWDTLSKACSRAQYVDYFIEQNERFNQNAIPHHISTRQQNNTNVKQFEYIDLSTLQAGLEEIKTYTDNIQAVIMSGSSLDWKKSPFYMHLEDTFQPLGLDEHLREIYDEYTTDPHQPPPPKDSKQPPTFSPTGIQLDELRFQNWVTVLEMMDMAQESEVRYQKALKKAQEDGVTFQSMPHRFPLAEGRTATTIEELRAKIKQLRRGTILESAPQSSYRRVISKKEEKHVAFKKEQVEAELRDNSPNVL